MSADNWAVCPQCVHNVVAEREGLIDQLRAAYGNVPIEEYEALKQKVASASESIDPENHQSFREDYEIYGADSGVIKVSYSGYCQVCDLGVDFEFKKEFYT